MTPSDAELHEALARALAERGAGVPIAVRRRPSEYRTSFPLERLTVVLDGGEELALAFKQLDRECLGEEARLAKPAFLHDPRREPTVYAELLGPAGVSAPRYYGAVLDEGTRRHWLFAEWVEGRELYQVGEIAIWRLAASSLAQMHAALVPFATASTAAPLIEHDAAFYRRWMERAREFRGEAEASREARSALEWLAGRHETVVEGLLAMPRTVVHGEFYASNVLVAVEAGAMRIAPVDWELAGRAPGLVDLAALISGGWSAAERSEIVAGYRGAACAPEFSAADLSLARLQVAIQWLGWAPPGWIPPEGQRHDWLAEAIALAEGLGL